MSYPTKDISNMSIAIIEVIFACTKCATFRQYGITPELICEPENPIPMLECIRCNRVTKHVFINNEHRTESRELEVKREARLFRKLYS